MSETCRLRRGEGYEACDDEVVNQCALRERKKARSASETPKRPAPPFSCMGEIV